MVQFNRETFSRKTHTAVNTETRTNLINCNQQWASNVYRSWKNVIAMFNKRDEEDKGLLRSDNTVNLFASVRLWRFLLTFNLLPPQLWFSFHLLPVREGGEGKWGAHFLAVSFVQLLFSPLCGGAALAGHHWETFLSGFYLAHPNTKKKEKKKQNLDSI